MDDPGVLSVLCQVLTAHQHRSTPRVTGDVMIDILRRVGLIVRKEAATGETNVLHEDHVQRQRAVAPIRDLQVPDPRSLVWLEREGRAVANAARLAFPHDAIFGEAQADGSARANSFSDRWRDSADAHEDSGQVPPRA